MGDLFISKHPFRKHQLTTPKGFSNREGPHIHEVCFHLHISSAKVSANALWLRTFMDSSNWKPWLRGSLVTQVVKCSQKPQKTLENHRTCHFSQKVAQKPKTPTKVPQKPPKRFAPFAQDTLRLQFLPLGLLLKHLFGPQDLLRLRCKPQRSQGFS